MRNLQLRYMKGSGLQISTCCWILGLNEDQLMSYGNIVIRGTEETMSIALQMITTFEMIVS
jgi:hypothetical protein